MGKSKYILTIPASPALLASCPRGQSVEIRVSCEEKMREYVRRRFQEILNAGKMNGITYTQEELQIFPIHGPAERIEALGKFVEEKGIGAVWEDFSLETTVGDWR